MSDLEAILARFLPVAAHEVPALRRHEVPESRSEHFIEPDAEIGGGGGGAHFDINISVRFSPPLRRL